MAASVAIEQTTAARGAAVYTYGAGYAPGRTVISYINGNYMGVSPTNINGAFSNDLNVPASTPTGAAKPVAAKDNTDIATGATTTLTVT